MVRSAGLTRISPSYVSLSNFQNVSSKRAEAKMNAVRNGDEMRKRSDYFLNDRKCQDVGWAVFFNVIALILLWHAVMLPIGYVGRISFAPVTMVSVPSTTSPSTTRTSSTSMTTSSSRTTTSISSTSRTTSSSSTTLSDLTSTTLLSRSTTLSPSSSATTPDLSTAPSSHSAATTVSPKSSSHSAATTVSPKSSSHSAATTISPKSVSGGAPARTVAPPLFSMESGSVVQESVARMLQSTMPVGPVGLVTLIITACAGGGFSLVASLVFLRLSHTHANGVVQLALMLGPIITSLGGVHCILLGLSSNLFGALLLVVGFVLLAGGIWLAFVMHYVFADLVPFTVRVVKIVSGIANMEHLRSTIMLPATAASIVGVVCIIACFMIILGGGVLANEDSLEYTKHQYLFNVFALCSLLWGVQVCINISQMAYCGLFGRWYFGCDGDQPVKPSFKVAVTTSFGSVCAGSFMSAFAQACNTMARRVLNESDTPVGVIARLVTMMLDCTGDILEYFNEWAYVQCAIRGVDFPDAALITFSLCTCANIHIIWEELLVDRVVFHASLICGVSGMVGGAVMGSLLDGMIGRSLGTLTGFTAGFVVGCASISILSSGTKTILTCWAEEPERLKDIPLFDDFENGVDYE